MTYSMITTTDNPFDPFENWDEWLAFDCRKDNLCHQYFNCSSCQMLAKFAPETIATIPSFTEELNEFAIDNVVNTFKDLNVFKKVQKTMN